MDKLLFVIPMHITFESFINPAHNSRKFLKKDGKWYNSLSTDLPLGAISMSAYLKKNIQEIEVKLIDFNAEFNSMEEFPFSSFYDAASNIMERYRDWQPTFVGVSSLFSPSFENFIELGRVSRNLFPTAIVLGGGNIPTNSHDHIYKTLREKSYDALCIGEGEKPLLNLLQASDKRYFLENSDSFATFDKVNRDTPFLPRHDFIDNLDEIPFFDYDLCDFDKHSTNFVSQTSFHNVEKKRLFHVMTSRGCPYLCTFCASHKTHGRKMRYHSLERVREDLTRLVHDYGANTVVFQDDHLMADKGRVSNILEIVKSLNVESLYQNGLTLYALDREMLQQFYDAGVRHLVLPVESGSEKVLKKDMRKPLKLNISERVASDCRDIGIYTNTNILIGMPNETMEDLLEGRLNLRRVKTNWFNIACASPIVGSEMHDQAKRLGYIKINNLGADFRTATISTPNFTAAQLQDFQYDMNLELNFVLNNDLARGEYKLALLAFRNVQKLRPDHAFSYYFSAYALCGLGEYHDAKSDFELYLKCSINPFWRPFVDKYELKRSLVDLASVPKPVAVEHLYSKIETSKEEIFS